MISSHDGTDERRPRADLRPGRAGGRCSGTAPSAAACPSAGPAAAPLASAPLAAAPLTASRSRPRPPARWRRADWAPGWRRAGWARGRRRPRRARRERACRPGRRRGRPRGRRPGRRRRHRGWPRRRRGRGRAPRRPRGTRRAEGRAPRPARGPGRSASGTRVSVVQARADGGHRGAGRAQRAEPAVGPVGLGQAQAPGQVIDGHDLAAPGVEDPLGDLRPPLDGELEMHLPVAVAALAGVPLEAVGGRAGLGEPLSDDLAQARARTRLGVTAHRRPLRLLGPVLPLGEHRTLKPAHSLDGDAGRIGDLVRRLAGPDAVLDLLRSQRILHFDLVLGEPGKLAAGHRPQPVIDGQREPSAPSRNREDRIRAVLAHCDEAQLLHRRPFRAVAVFAARVCVVGNRVVGDHVLSVSTSSCPRSCCPCWESARPCREDVGSSPSQESAGRRPAWPAPRPACPARAGRNCSKARPTYASTGGGPCPRPVSHSMQPGLRASPERRQWPPEGVG